MAYDAIRWAGAAYLVWLGARALLRPGSSREASLAPASLGAIFRQGVVTNVLNPKVALFFLAFLPQFVDARRGDPIAQTVALGLLFDVQGTLVNVIVALVASRVSGRLRARGSTRALQRVTGAVFVLLGLRLAVRRA